MMPHKQGPSTCTNDRRVPHCPREHHASSVSLACYAPLFVPCPHGTARHPPLLDSQALRLAKPLRYEIEMYRIDIDDLSTPDVAEFLAEHLKDMRATSPPESVHALDIEALRRPEITFWTLKAGDQILGTAALKELDATHGEIKSMRTTATSRRQGIAAKLLTHLIDVATERGYTRLSLETGSMAFLSRPDACICDLASRTEIRSRSTASIRTAASCTSSSIKADRVACESTLEPVGFPAIHQLEEYSVIGCVCIHLIHRRRHTTSCDGIADIVDEFHDRIVVGCCECSRWNIADVAVLNPTVLHEERLNMVGKRHHDRPRRAFALGATARRVRRRAVTARHRIGSCRTVAIGRVATVCRTHDWPRAATITPERHTRDECKSQIRSASHAEVSEKRVPRRIP